MKDYLAFPANIKLFSKILPWIVGALWLSIAHLPARASDVSGMARIVDGDTIVVGTTKVRLEGIDAPETDQICLDSSSRRWACGIEARNQLAGHIAQREITCSSSDMDAYGRALGVCKLGGESLNGWMVQNGWALAYVKYSAIYAREEENARRNQRGLWSGAFIAPWDWRHRNAKTAIIGALSVPISAQSMLLPRAATDGSPSLDCVIKGNINRDGERIYHTPGQHFYSRIQMSNGAGRRWFCTAEEAEAAGFRRALR